MTMTKRTKPSPKRPALTDAERHARFIETAKATDADESPQAFDRAFAKVATAPKTKS